MARWLVVVGALAIAGCSSSDLDDLCKRANALSERRDEPATKRVLELFEGWAPESKQGKEIRQQMIRDGEIASYGVFRKLISSKASTAWQCPALERLMVETDAPLLAPEGHRGRRNEPARVTLVGEMLAKIRGASPEEIARVTTANARACFRLPEAG